MGKPDRRAGSGKSVVHTSRAGFAYLLFFRQTVRLSSRFGLWAFAEVSNREGPSLKSRKWLDHRCRT